MQNLYFPFTHSVLGKVKWRQKNELMDLKILVEMKFHHCNLQSICSDIVNVHHSSHMTTPFNKMKTAQKIIQPEFFRPQANFFHHRSSECAQQQLNDDMINLDIYLIWFDSILLYADASDSIRFDSILYIIALRTKRNSNTAIPAQVINLLSIASLSWCLFFSLSLFFDPPVFPKQHMHRLLNSLSSFFSFFFTWWEVLLNG